MSRDTCCHELFKSMVGVRASETVFLVSKNYCIEVQGTHSAAIIMQRSKSIEGNENPSPPRGLLPRFPDACGAGAFCMPVPKGAELHNTLFPAVSAGFQEVAPFPAGVVD